MVRMRERKTDRESKEREKNEFARGNVSTFYHALPIASKNSRISKPLLRPNTTIG